MPASRPSLSLPEPLRGSEAGTFTHHSVANRLPEIGRRMLAENAFLTKNAFPTTAKARLTGLFDGIPKGQIRHLTDENAPDVEAWSRAIEPYVGHDWLQVPWFFAETYFYRRIMEATGYFGQGPGRGVDPFAYQKDQGLATGSAAINALSDRVEAMLGRGDSAGREDSASPGREAWADLLRMDLWSNQADLSLWPAGSEPNREHGNEDQKQAHILVDDTSKVVEYRFGLSLLAKRVDFLVDNAGIELVVDLGFAVYLLGMEIAEEVHLHVKAHPTFVSDVIAGDVHHTAAVLAASDHRATACFGERVQHYLDEGRLRIRAHIFWTSPLAMWEIPEDLRLDLGQAALVISKGDANYRRLLGDRHWPFTTSFDDIMTYFPAPVAALRTLKSEIACGLQPGQAEQTERKDPDWLTNGKWGVIQFSNPVTGQSQSGGEA